MHLVVMCASPNYYPNLSAADIGAKNPIWNFDKGVPLFVSIPYQGFLRFKVSINCNKLKTHSPVWCRSLEVSEPSGLFPVLNGTCQNLYFKEILILMDYHIKPDTPINVYTRFCLNTAKSKFSLVSPVADWWKTINKQLNWIVYY